MSKLAYKTSKILQNVKNKKCPKENKSTLINISSIKFNHAKCFVNHD